MIRIILIDDEPLARSIVEEYLQSYPQIEIVAQCNNGFEGLKAIMQHKPDLIFLDIQMPKINGFEMLELCEYMPAIIFTSAFDEYAVKAFDNNAIDYLLKPFAKERFEKALQKYLDNMSALPQETKLDMLLNINKQPEEKERVVVKNGNNIRIIHVNEIIYIEAYDDYVKIITLDGTFLKKKTMQYYENTLSTELFLRVHRSFLLQLNQITKVELFEKNSHIALLKNGSKIPLSRSGYAKLKAVLEF